MNNLLGTRPQNIIVFSSGAADRCGRLDNVIERLRKHKHNPSKWRELFDNANNESDKALLPSLIKKIPTFDFAVIIGDKADLVSKFRDDDTEMAIMRDNVVFETGLCIMALGAERVILLVEKGVRIPDDHIGGDSRRQERRPDGRQYGTQPAGHQDRRLEWRGGNR